MDQAYHTPVLLGETLASLLTGQDGIYVDGTLGGGGHAEPLLERLGPRSRLVGFDRDPDAVAAASARLARFGGRIEIINANAAHLARLLRERGIGEIQGALFDLGVSSYQLDEASRGFSFQHDGVVDMRMDKAGGRDGRAVVNEYSAARLAEIFWEYGEERAARRIAAGIVRAREAGPIQTTVDLARIVGRAAGGGNMLQKTLARVFQAIRIEVNDELGNLRHMLRDAVRMLAPRGRIVVISYHSLEDRIVKEYFRDEARTVIRAASKLAPDEARTPVLKLVVKKPITAGDAECAANPRARSAKMRVAEKL